MILGRCGASSGSNDLRKRGPLRLYREVDVCTCYVNLDFLHRAVVQYRLPTKEHSDRRSIFTVALIPCLLNVCP